MSFRHPHCIVQSYKLEVTTRIKFDIVKYFHRSKILATLRLLILFIVQAYFIYYGLDVRKIYASGILYCLNRLITYFYKINFL